MTQMQTLSLEYEELMARADELEAPIEGLPLDNPQAPCALAMVIAAAQQLGLSADNMRVYLGVAIDREWPSLAETLRDAAAAYEEVDENAAAAANTGSASVSAANPRRVRGVLDPVRLGATQVAATTASDPGDYADLKQTAWDVDQPDQGVAFNQFADAWEAYRYQLLVAQDRFRHFDAWTGESAEVMEAHLQQHRTWLGTMAELCGMVAAQAREVAATHRWAWQEHPRYADIVELEMNHARAVAEGNANRQQTIMRDYEDAQQKSEEVLAEYRSRAQFPLSPAQPTLPPVAIDLPGQSDMSPWDLLGLNDDFPDATGMPIAAPMAYDDAPMLDDALTGAMAGASGPSAMGSGVKPASFGGAPSMPLQPLTEGGSTLPATAVRDGAVGGATPGAGRPMGGGMGMAPMGPGANGQPQNNNNRKRSHENQALYTEDRPWTEAIIRLRRPKEDTNN